MKKFALTVIFACGLLLNPAAAVQTSLDKIVAIVDESVITERELELPNASWRIGSNW
jgi:hypothetical protein